MKGRKNGSKNVTVGKTSGSAKMRGAVRKGSRGTRRAQRQSDRAWEAGTTEPSAEILIDLCKLYGVSISFFFPPTVQQTIEYAVIDLSDEMELVDIYRSISKDGQRALMTTARAMASEYTIVEK